MAKRYSVSDGKLVLTLEEAPEGGFVVTSPMDPALITEAETIREAFLMARDALRTLRQGRAKLPRDAKRRPRMAG
jgi:predicted RNase H-like HicB family nuclease